MKYKEMSEEQKEAFRQYFIDVLRIKSQEEQQYVQQAYRLLILGNGTGIVLLATFMGALAGKAANFHLLVAPLTKFFIGAIFAALVYIPLMAVSNQATITIAKQITDFFLNKKDVEEIQGYGFNKIGWCVVRTLLILSAVAFFWGVYECLSILKNV
jgi:hypothetical protein